MHSFSTKGSLHCPALTPRPAILRSCHLAAGPRPARPFMPPRLRCHRASQPWPTACNASRHSAARLTVRLAQPCEHVRRSSSVRPAASGNAGQRAACLAAHTADVCATHSASPAGVTPLWDERGSDAPTFTSSETLASTPATRAAANGAHAMVARHAVQTPASGTAFSAGVAAQPRVVPVPAAERSPQSDAPVSVGSGAEWPQPAPSDSAGEAPSVTDSSAAGDSAASNALAPGWTADVEAASTSSASMSSDGEVGRRSRLAILPRSMVSRMRRVDFPMRHVSVWFRAAVPSASLLRLHGCIGSKTQLRRGM